MSIIDKATKIKDKIISLKEEDVSNDEISEVMVDDLEEFLTLKDEYKYNPIIIESLKIINSTGINQDFDIFSDAGLDNYFENVLPLEILIEHFKDSNETINFNGRQIPKYDLARKINQLKYFVSMLYDKLIFEQDIDTTLVFKEEELVKTINSGEF
jgi:hypothetical protein